MSNIWNPHAFGVTGQPVGPQVNTLRVYGAEPSKEQLAMAQQAFAKFCMTERLSFAPNQTQQGFLPDGSKYRIVVVGNTRIMEVRVGVVGAVTAYSGIRFPGTTLLLVNEGSMDTPSTKWKVVDIAGLDIDIESGKDQLHAEYNQYVELTVSRSLDSKNRYMYASTETVGRYGNVFAYADRSDCYVATILEDGTALWIKQSPSNGSVQIFRGDASDIIFPEYGAARKSTYETISLDSGELLMSPEENQYLSSRAVASKDGSVIAFGVTTSEKTNGHSLVSGSTVDLHSYHRFFALAAERYGEYGIFSYRAGLPGPAEYRERNFSTKIVRCNLAGTSYGAPSTVQSLDDGNASPLTKYSVISLPADSVIYFDHANSSLEVKDTHYPKHLVATVTQISYDPIIERYEWYYTTSGNGLVKYVGTRNESSSSVLSLQCAGANMIASVVAEDTFSYEHRVLGNITANGFGYVSGPIEYKPSPGEFPVAPYFSTSTTAAETTVKTIAKRTIALDPIGASLVASTSTYTENSSLSLLDEFTADGGEETNYVLHDSDLSYVYTLHKEERSLMAFDPALDLLCYTEVVSDVTSTGSHRNRWKTIYTASDSSETTNREIFSTSGGVPLPTPPTPKLIIKCRGASIEIALPFYSTSDSAFEQNRLRRLMELFANTGIAPGTPAVSSYAALEPVQIFRTEEGFADLGSVSLQAAADATEDQRAMWTFSRFRGLSPNIAHPKPTVTLTKTPETGGGLLTVTLDDGAVIRKRYLIDAAGIREADAVLTGLPPMTSNVLNNKGVPF